MSSITTRYKHNVRKSVSELTTHQTLIQKPETTTLLEYSGYNGYRNWTEWVQNSWPQTWLVSRVQAAGGSEIAERVRSLRSENPPIL